MQEPAPENNFQQAHAMLIIKSFQHTVGRPILPVATAEILYHTPQIILSHNTQDDPVLTYGNLAAQTLWQRPWAELTQLPSRLTAEPAHRTQRADMFDKMRKFGFFENYTGIRISATGQRFEIHNATIWTLTDAQGKRRGEAATFTEFTPL